jgi:hypothetical protein
LESALQILLALATLAGADKNAEREAIRQIVAALNDVRATGAAIDAAVWT